MFAVIRRIGLVLVAAAVSGCAEEPPTNLLLLVPDTLRAESLSCYGGAAHTPNICSLAEQGVLFERAYANAPWTLPSVVSMFTGSYPLQHRRTRQGRDGKPLPFYFVDQSEHLIGEAFVERGFQVSAVLENTVASQPQALQGFTVVNSTRQADGGPPARLGDSEVGRYGLDTEEPGYRLIAQSMARLLEIAEAPFFHMHWLDDPHAPYRPPEAEKAASEAGELPREATFYQRLGHQNKGVRRHLRSVADSLEESEIDFLERLYELEIESVDRRIGALLRTLDATGQRQRTLIVLTSDHGEEFGEHGGFLHDHAMWDEVVRVPLIVAGPGVTAGRRIRQTVSLVDLAPTLVDFFALEGLGPFQGESLRPVLTSRRREPTVRPHHITSTITHDLEAVVRGRYKLIAATDGSSVALYDLEADPEESIDLAPNRAALVAELQQAMAAARAENERAWEGRYYRDHPELLDEAARKTEESLRDLGYLN
jgi:arylsulfatase A-like enzyme